MVQGLTLYHNQGSGNCYKVRLLLHQLGYAFSCVDVDVVKGETRTPDFLRINPEGRVPVLDFGDGRRLSESNAIMLYFAEETQYLPDEPFDRAQVHQWLFWEQYSHEPRIAVARYLMHYLGKTEADEPRLTELWEKGRAALGVMEGHLAEREFFVGGRYTIADIALYAYTHVAGQGGFDLGAYPALRAWIDRVATQPRHIAIDDVVW